MRVMFMSLLFAATTSAQLSWTTETTIDGDPVMRGLPKDAIPAIDAPVFVPAGEASFMVDEEPVIGVAIGGAARAYPTWLLNGHEIVNDTIGGRPITVTW